VNDESTQDQSEQPVQDSGQPDAEAQEPRQGENYNPDAIPAQEEPAADSNLTTEQPDQPVRPESERQSDGITAEPGPSGQPAEGTVRPASYPEQEQAEVQKEQELEQARRERSERTGGGEVREGEVQAQRQEHNQRTGGGDVPQ
jgi:hypothetical protein